MVAGLTPASNAARMIFACPGEIGVVFALVLAAAGGARFEPSADPECAGEERPPFIGRPRRPASSMTAFSSVSS